MTKAHDEAVPMLGPDFRINDVDDPQIEIPRAPVAPILPCEERIVSKSDPTTVTDVAPVVRITDISPVDKLQSSADMAAVYDDTVLPIVRLTSHDEEADSDIFKDTVVCEYHLL